MKKKKITCIKTFLRARHRRENVCRLFPPPRRRRWNCNVVSLLREFRRDSVFERERKKEIKKLAAVLTLSYLMDLWLRGKFCPTFEVRRSGGEEERFASGVRSCVLVCYWEFSPTRRDANNSLVSLNLWPTWMDGGMDGGGKKICSTHFYSYAACTPRNLSSQNPSVLDWFAPCFFFFYVWQTSN